MPPYTRALIDNIIFEVLHNTMGDPSKWFESPAFRIPEYSPQGGMAYPAGSMSNEYDTAPPKAGTHVTGPGSRFGDSYTRPIPLVNTTRPLSERQRIWGGSNRMLAKGARAAMRA